MSGGLLALLRHVFVFEFSRVARYLTVVLQFAINPEAAARRKQQRSVAKKEGRKRKSTMFA